METAGMLGVVSGAAAWPPARWNIETLTFLRTFYGAQRSRLEQKLLFGNRQEEKKR